MKYIEESHVVLNNSISRDVYRMELKCSKIAKESKAGQFLQIKVGNENAPLLRRPISIGEINPQENTVIIYYKVVGKGTDLLSKVNKDGKINIIGPLGNGFITDYEGYKIDIVGGGIGIAPLLEVTKELKKKNYIRTYLGFNDETYLLDEFSNISNEVKITTVTGIEGEKGYITDVLKKDIKKNKPDLIISCGPMVMLKKVSEVAKKENIKCQISLEERMACGFGACLGCSIEISGGMMKKVCVDGPVFWSDEVVFSE